MKGALGSAGFGEPGQRGAAALGSLKSGDGPLPEHSPANHPQQPTAVKPAQEAAASTEPPPRRPRMHWTVYCQTCSRNFYTYVLGRGVVPFSRASANARAEQHRHEQPGHVVSVRSSSAAGVPTLTRETSAGPEEMSASAAAEGERP